MSEGKLDTEAPATSPDGAQRVRLLLISDIHLAVRRIADVGDWLVARGIKVDAVICPGDFCIMSTEDQSSTAQVTKGEGDMSHLLSCLENLAVRVVYVPGNHDPVTTLSVKDKLPRLTCSSRNLHMQSVQLAPGLRVVGFGGSIPAYQDGKEVWEGYPYTEEQLGEGVLRAMASKPHKWPAVGDQTAKTLLAPAPAPTPASEEDGKSVDDDEVDVEGDEGEAGGDDAVILVTHVGPMSSGTTVDSHEAAQPPILAGSSALDNLVRTPELQSKVLANIHGHVHEGSGQCFVGKVRVVNPGSVKYGGRFGTMTLVKHEGSPWDVEACTFYTI